MLVDLLEPACPTNWEYEDVDGYYAALVRRSAQAYLLVRISNKHLKDELAVDTRPVHRLTFVGLTPTHFPYFAGNYRGSEHRCLAVYEVGIRGERPAWGAIKVGHPAGTVLLEMEALELQIRRAQAELDQVWDAPSAMLPREAKFFRTVEIAAAIFVHWLEIHPYANGNGHMARFILTCLFGRHDAYFNKDMAMHPRPQEPQYSSAIKAHRSGNPQPLHLLLIGCF